MSFEPGRVPPQLTGTAAHMPKLEEWDPSGDVHLPDDFGALGYVPAIVRAPPQMPRPEQHPHRPEFPPRQYERIFLQTPAPGGVNRQLAFTASSVRVDNYSSHWVFIQSAGVFVPPFIYGAIVNLNPGVSVAGIGLTPPPGYSDPTPVLESMVLTIWYEDEIVNSPGVPIQSSFRSGASGGSVVSGPLLFNPDNTYDIGASGANRPRNLYLGGTATVQGDFSCANIYTFADTVFMGATGAAWRGGNTAPAAGLGNNGDFFFRSDTPGVANQRVYVKSAGAWVGII